MLEFACGIAVGAAFSKFWIALFNFVKSKTPWGKDVPNA